MPDEMSALTTALLLAMLIIDRLTRYRVPGRSQFRRPWRSPGALDPKKRGPDIGAPFEVAKQTSSAH